LAGVFVDGRGFGGVGDIVVGIIGAFVGGFLFDIAGVAYYGFWPSVAVSAIGAIVFLFIAGLFYGPRRV
ncbi:MAG: GlsB/YeaQ/YmgE family stress response membrane protein, partial [Pseudobdellovibrio sp.]